MPVRAEHLVAGEHGEVDAERGEVERQVRRGLAGVQHGRARRPPWASATSSATGFTIPSTFDTWVNATTRVRSPMTDAAASRSSVPSSCTGMSRSVAPVRAASSCHGMRLA